jgi:hypothetical protein
VWNVSTLAGNSGGSAADGVGTLARFNYPAGVAADVDGEVYVADRVNNMIRRVTLGGVVSTLAGTPGVPGSSTNQWGFGASLLLNGPRALLQQMLAEAQGGVAATLVCSFCNKSHAIAVPELQRKMASA